MCAKLVPARSRARYPTLTKYLGAAVLATGIGACDRAVDVETAGDGPLVPDVPPVMLDGAPPPPMPDGPPDAALDAAPDASADAPDAPTVPDDGSPPDGDR